MTNDWIEWSGGQCPVAEGTLVDLQFPDRVIFEHVLAEDWVWDHNQNAGDIIAYRVVKEAPSGNSTVPLREEFKTFIESRCRLAMEGDDWETAHEMLELYERL